MKVSAASIAAVLSGHAVNVFRISSVQGDEAADRSSAHKAAFVRQLFDLGVGKFDFHVADRGRHTNGTEKVFHGGDAFKCCFFVIAEAVGNIQHVDCQLREAAGILFEHITGPAAPDRCKACTVSDIEHTAQFMLQLVGSPVALAAVAGDVIVGKSARPHDLGADVIVVGCL